MSLKELQKSFLGHIYNDLDSSQKITQHLNPQCPVGVENGLRIYKDNLLHALIKYMSDVYVLTNKALGEQNFRFFVRELLYSSPSQNTDIRAYGSKFRDFLRERDELKDSKWAEGLAGYEWLSYDILYKAQPSPMNEEELKKFESYKLADLTVECIPSLYLYHCPWPIVKMVKMLEGDSREDITPLESFTALYARDGKLKTEELHPNLWHVLRDYKDGRSLDHISKKAYSERSVETTWKMLLHCVKSGYIKDVRVAQKLSLHVTN